jgi:hypothetical protein
MTGCRVCGCTDDDCAQCIERTGEPCYWVEFELCSACAAGPVCPDCGHKHTGVELGQICIGCPCLSVPAMLGRPVRYHPARVQANADDYPDAAELAARRAR